MDTKNIFIIYLQQNIHDVTKYTFIIFLFSLSFLQSHAFRKARWQGVCAAFPDFINNHFPASVVLNQATPQSCGAIQRLAQELCDKLEQLSVSAQT